MRIFRTVLALVVVLPGPALADDSSPVAGKLPDNDRSQQTYLFSLKKNGISIRIGPDQFCRDLGYGTAVRRSDDPGGKRGFWEQGNIESDGDDGRKKPGELAWVICQFPGKSK